ncbi:MAG TPA: RDD family protein [Chitinophagaceae bacterium]|nr:RDD family protein [Chitinophagaceae bacterium]
MLAVKLDTGFNIEVEFPISPFHRRLFAWIIDLMILLAYLWITDILISEILSDYWTAQDWLVVLYLLPYFFYHLIMEISLNGQSIGKKAMSIKVITLEGGQPSLSQYIIRWMFRIFDIGLFFVPAFFSIILSARSQRVGDIVAGTIVIDTKARTSWEDTIFTEVETTYKPRYKQVMQLSDKDINTLKSIIETVRRKSDYELAFNATERIKSRLNIQSDQDPFDFLQTLLKDYNYYAINN